MFAADTRYFNAGAWKFGLNEVPNGMPVPCSTMENKCTRVPSGRFAVRIAWMKSDSVHFATRPSEWGVRLAACGQLGDGLETWGGVRQVWAAGSPRSDEGVDITNALDFSLHARAAWTSTSVMTSSR